LRAINVLTSYFQAELAQVLEEVGAGGVASKTGQGHVRVQKGLFLLARDICLCLKWQLVYPLNYGPISILAGWVLRAQLGSSVVFGSGCGKALPGVPRKAPLC